MVSIRAYLSVLLLTLFLVACGGGGGSGGSDDLNPGGDPPEIGPAPGSGASLLSITISPDEPVLKSGSSLQLYAVGNYSDGGQVDLTNSLLWLGVGDVSVSSSGVMTALQSGSGLVTASDAATTITDTTFAYVSDFDAEGSVANPMVLSADTPYAGEVNDGGPSRTGYSYYAVNVTPGSAYYVFLEDRSGNVHLELYDDAAYSSRVCASDPFAMERLCYAQGPSAGVLYIAVNGDDTTWDIGQGASYTLAVESGYKDENIPLNVNAPHNGAVGRMVYDNVTFSYLSFGSSIYEVAITPSARYTVLMSNLTDNANMAVLTLNNVVVCQNYDPGLSNETCSFQLSESAVKISIGSVDTRVGAGYSLTITEGHGAYVSEGSVAAPVDITGSMPYHGHSDGVHSFYMANVTPLQSYEVRATGLDDGITMRVYDGDATFTNFDCSDSSNGTVDLVCRLEPAVNDMLYTRMGFISSEGVEYFLNVTPISYTPQGSSVAPIVVLTTPVLGSSYVGEVDTTASYYQIPVAAGELYRVGLASLSGDVTLNVYDDAALTSLLCTSNNAALADESCLTEPSMPSTGNIFVEVLGSTYGSKFDITVDRVYRAEGTAAAPLDVTALLPYDGETGPGTATVDRSHYQVSLTNGKSYRLILTNPSNQNLDFRVFDDGPSLNWTNHDCSTVGMAADVFYCDISPISSGGLIDIQLMAGIEAVYGAAFTLDVIEVPYVSQGNSAAPLVIGSYPVADSVGTQRLEYIGAEVDNGQSYYVADVSGGYAYVNYKVSLANLSSNVDLFVYDDAAYTNLLCTSNNASTTAEICAALSLAGTQLYIKVDGSPSGFGGLYDLVVDHDYQAEGSPLIGNGGGASGGAVMLTLGAPYQGEADGISGSYYGVTGVTPGQTYTVTITQKQDSACTWVHDETEGRIDTFSVASDSNKWINDSVLNVTPVTTGIFLRVVGCGSTNTGSAYTVTIN